MARLFKGIVKSAPKGLADIEFPELVLTEAAGAARAAVAGAAEVLGPAALGAEIVATGVQLAERLRERARERADVDAFVQRHALRGTPGGFMPSEARLEQEAPRPRINPGRAPSNGLRQRIPRGARVAQEPPALYDDPGQQADEAIAEAARRSRVGPNAGIVTPGRVLTGIASGAAAAAIAGGLPVARATPTGPYDVPPIPGQPQPPPATPVDPVLPPTTPVDPAPPVVPTDVPPVSVPDPVPPVPPVIPVPPVRPADPVPPVAPPVVPPVKINPGFYPSTGRPGTYDPYCKRSNTRKGPYNYFSHEYCAKQVALKLSGAQPAY